MKRKVEQTYDDKEIIINTLSKMILKVFDNIKNNKSNSKAIPIKSFAQVINKFNNFQQVPKTCQIV